MFQDKNPEVSVCDASLIRNVWEIRTKTYGKKLKKEHDRVQKSALDQINLQWQQRMTTTKRGPPRTEKRATHSEISELQNYLNKPFLSDVSRIGGLSNSTFQRGLKQANLSKRGKLILNIYKGQPILLKWGKSWRFSRPRPHMEEEGIENGSVSDWGKSWKFLNLQPNLKDQPWSEQDLSNDNLDSLLHNGFSFLSKQVKSKNVLNNHIFEQESPSEWGESWKFTKHPSQEKESSSEEGSINGSPHKDIICLTNGSMQLHEDEMSEWRESWKVPKPHERDFQSVVVKPMEDVDHKENKKETSVSTWFESWMILYHQQAIEKTPQSPDWSESWKFLHFPSRHEEESHTDEHISEESPDIHTFERMFLLKESRSNMLFNSQLHKEDWSTSEWRKSWEIIKPQAQALPQNDQKQEPEDEPKKGKSEDLKPNKEVCISIKSKARHFLSPHFFSDELFASEWGESWKSLKPQSYQKVEQYSVEISSDKSLVDQLNEKQRSISDWSESWKLSHNEMLFKLQAEKSRRFCEPHLHEEQLSLTKRDESWKFSNLQRHKEGETSSKKCKIITFQNSEWVLSWKFVNLPLNQKKESWEKSWTKYLLFDYQPNKDRSYLPTEAESNVTHSETLLKWGKSWMISIPQPHMKSESWLKAQDFHHQYGSIFLMKDRCSKSLYSQINKDSLSLRLWGHSWKMLKPQAENKTKPKSGKSSNKDSSDLNTYIMLRRSKARKVLLFQLEKELSSRKWGEAWRLAKTQPRQKRGSWLKTNKGTVNEDKADRPDWSESWKFLYNQQAEEKSFMSEWVESWKYLLTHQQDTGERSK